MGLFDDVFDAAVKIVTAPVTIPYKIMKETEDLLKGPSKYEYWHHDSGKNERPEDDNEDD